VNRDALLAEATARGVAFDVVVIGGGATGAGIALDAASRGLSVLLLERADFGAGTSSRSSKLIHGGIRYLAQGRFGLVRQALHERAILCRIAPHLVQPLRFVIPAATRWDLLRFAAGARLYDVLAGASGLGRSRLLSGALLERQLPNLARSRFVGGVEYSDAQFDDTRLLLAVLRTAVAHGARVANYCRVTALPKTSAGRIAGVRFVDTETGTEHAIAAAIVINAAGAWVDAIRGLDDPARPATITFSRGAHLVVDRDYLPSDRALVFPQTPDGRIMFAIPWQERLLLGTTDTALAHLPETPRPLPAEIGQILDVARSTLERAPAIADVRARFAGVRSLPRNARIAATAGLSREHRIEVARSGLISVVGGKWTTYRRMAADALDAALRAHGLAPRPCVTEHLPLIGATTACHEIAPFAAYGAEASKLHELIARHPELGARLHPALPYVAAQCVFAVRHEMARKVEDVLARRVRALFLDEVAALAAAPGVAALMAAELGRDCSWQERELALVRDGVA
jgi:glycerol-3-phosphate dehydrogenase